MTVIFVPGEFIPSAGGSNLITEVGAYVLTEACRAGAAWRAAGHGIEISVNVSATQLDSTEFTAFVRDTLNRTKFPAAALILEVTESRAVSEASMNDGTLRGLRSLGIGISVDDFGSGYSSLAQLHRLPVTEVKIDRSFTTRLAEEGSAAFIAGIVGLGHGLGLRVVAEGVETQGQLDAIRAMGCERVQGYLYGKPVAATVLEDCLAYRCAPPGTGLGGFDEGESACSPLASQRMVARSLPRPRSRRTGRISGRGEGGPCRGRGCEAEAPRE